MFDHYCIDRCRFVLDIKMEMFRHRQELAEIAEHYREATGKCGLTWWIILGPGEIFLDGNI